MNVRRLIDAILQPDEELLRNVMAVLRDGLRDYAHLQSSAAFAQVINPKLEEFGVELDTGADKLMRASGSPAMLQNNGWVKLRAVNPAYGEREIKDFPAYLRHELVHREQYANMGDQAEQVISGIDARVADKQGNVDVKTYLQVPQEQMAYAKSYVDDLANSGYSKDEILDTLRSGRLGRSRFGAFYLRLKPAERQRFMRYAADYANNL